MTNVTLEFSMIIFTMILTYFSFSSNRRIFSVIAIGPAWVLLMEYQAEPLLAISIAGLILFNGYYAFFGEYNVK